MDAVPGLRVVRGPHRISDTKHDDNEGCTGTVVEQCEELVSVLWDSGEKQEYRLKDRNRTHELLVLDSAPAAVHHLTVSCEVCKEAPLYGMRWHCLDCKASYDLCTSCYMMDEHQKHHAFERIDEPEKPGVKVGRRGGSDKVQAKGIFLHARVERGPDWRYKKQDGGAGKQGVVKKITNWNKIQRSAAQVSWDYTDTKTYRVGLNGKLDIICKSPGVGWHYYRDHLPKLGVGKEREVYDSHNQGTVSKAAEEPLREGDEVLVSSPIDEIISLNAGICDWTDDMKNPTVFYLSGTGSTTNDLRPSDNQANCETVIIDFFTPCWKLVDLLRHSWVLKCIGKVGIVQSFTKKRAVNVFYEASGETWTFHPGVVTKVSQPKPHHIPKEMKKGRKQKTDHKSVKLPGTTLVHRGELQPGDVVRVMEDEGGAKTLQVGHGPWNQSVCDCLGKTGRVVSVDADGDVELMVDGQENTIIFNPEVLVHLPSMKEKVVDAGKKVTTNSQEPQRSLKEKEKRAESHGLQISQEEYTSGPPEPRQPINAPETIETVSKHITPPAGADKQLGEILTFSSGQGNIDLVQQLLDSSPSLLDYCGDSLAPLHRACQGGHVGVVLVLLQRGADIKVRDSQGHTPLHHSCHGDYEGSTAKLLLEFGADMHDNINQEGHTPLHLAVRCHNEACATILVQNGCDVSRQDSRGRMPLHTAVMVQDIAMVNLLLNAETRINIRIQDRFKFNPFILAVQQKFKRAAKRMVEYSDSIVNSAGQCGMTALHFSALNEDVEMTRFLLQTGLCDVNARTNDGVTAADLAQSMECYPVLQLLASCDFSSNQEGMKEALNRSLRSKSGPSYARQNRTFTVGDVVRVRVKAALLKKLQIAHGDYNPGMATDEVGHVLDVDSDGDVVVFFENPGRQYCYNPVALKNVQEEADQTTPNVPPLQTGMVSLWEDDLPHILVEMETEKRNTEPTDVFVEDIANTLFRAVSMDHICSVRNILEIYPEAVNERLNGRTPLHLACKDGSLGTVKMLLDKGAFIDAKDDKQFTPLHYAALGDATAEVAETLVNLGANASDCVNKYRATPLHFAVFCSNEATIKVLLQWPCGANQKNIQGNTALHEAVKAEKVALTSALLSSHGVDPQVLDGNGRSAFHVAVLSGNELIVRMLVVQYADLVNLQTTEELSPLLLACQTGRSSVAEFLLNTGKCDIHARDQENRTALALASNKDMHSVVKRLLEIYDSEGNVESVEEASSESATPDGQKRKPDAAEETVHDTETKAEEEEHDFPFKILCDGDVVKVRSELEIVCSLQRGNEQWNKDLEETLGRVGKVSKVTYPCDVEVTFSDEKEDTQRKFVCHPAALVLISRNESTDSPAVSYQDFKADIVDSEPRSAKEETSDGLFKATITCDVPKVKHILQVNPTLVDSRPGGFTALHLACRKGFCPIVKVLLERGANCELQDKDGLCPLHLSAVYDKSGTSATVLLQNGANSASTTSNNRHTPLHLAVLRNNKLAARTLVNLGCDLSQKDATGSSAIQYALNQEKEEMLGILLEATSCELRLTVLHDAISSGNCLAVKTLTEHDPRLVNEPNNEGETSLHAAVLSKRFEILQLLLQVEDVHINAVNKKEETPLKVAMSNNLEMIADILLDRGGTFAGVLVPSSSEQEEIRKDSPDDSDVDASQQIEAKAAETTADSFVSIQSSTCLDTAVVSGAKEGEERRSQLLEPREVAQNVGGVSTSKKEDCCEGDNCGDGPLLVDVCHDVLQSYWSDASENGDTLLESEKEKTECVDEGQCPVHKLMVEETFEEELSLDDAMGKNATSVQIPNSEESQGCLKLPTVEKASEESIHHHATKPLDKCGREAKLATDVPNSSDPEDCGDKYALGHTENNSPFNINLARDEDSSGDDSCSRISEGEHKESKREHKQKEYSTDDDQRHGVVGYPVNDETGSLESGDIHNRETGSDQESNSLHSSVVVQNVHFESDSIMKSSADESDDPTTDVRNNREDNSYEEHGGEDVPVDFQNDETVHLESDERHNRKDGTDQERKSKDPQNDFIEKSRHGDNDEPDSDEGQKGEHATHEENDAEDLPVDLGNDEIGNVESDEIHNIEHYSDRGPERGDSLTHFQVDKESGDDECNSSKSDIKCRTADCGDAESRSTDCVHFRNDVDENDNTDDESDSRKSGRNWRDNESDQESKDRNYPVDFQDDEIGILESDEKHNQEKRSSQETNNKDCSVDVKNVDFENESITKSCAGETRDLMTDTRNNIEHTISQEQGSSLESHERQNSENGNSKDYSVDLQNVDVENDPVQKNRDDDIDEPKSDERNTGKHNTDLGPEESEHSNECGDNECCTSKSDERCNSEDRNEKELCGSGDSVHLQADQERNSVGFQNVHFENDSTTITRPDDRNDSMVEKRNNREQCSYQEKKSADSPVDFQNDATGSLESDERQNRETGSDPESKSNDSSVDFQYDNDDNDEPKSDKRSWEPESEDSIAHFQTDKGSGDGECYLSNSCERCSDEDGKDKESRGDSSHFRNDFVAGENTGIDSDSSISERNNSDIGSDPKSREIFPVDFQNEETSCSEHNEVKGSTKENTCKDSSVDFQNVEFENESVTKNSVADNDDAMPDESNNIEHICYQVHGTVDPSVDFQNDEMGSLVSDEKHNIENGSDQESKNKDSSVDFETDPIPDCKQSSDDDRDDRKSHENSIEHSSDQVPETEDFQNDFVKESSDGEVTHCPEADERCRNGEGINDESSDEDSVDFQNDETVSLESDERRDIEHGSNQESESKDSSVNSQNDAIKESSDDDSDDLNPHERNNIERNSDQGTEIEDFQNEFVKESSDGEVTHCPESYERLRNDEGINDESSDEDSVDSQNDETVSLESDERRDIEHGSNQESESKDSSVNSQNDAIKESSDDDRDDLNPHERNNIERRSGQDQGTEIEDFQNEFVKDSSDGEVTHCPESDERCRNGDGSDNESRGEVSVDFQNDETVNLESDEMHNRGDKESEDEDSSVDFQNDHIEENGDDRDDRKSDERNNKGRSSDQVPEIEDFQKEFVKESSDNEGSHCVEADERCRSGEGINNERRCEVSVDFQNDGAASLESDEMHNRGDQESKDEDSSVDFQNYPIQENANDRDERKSDEINNIKHSSDRGPESEHTVIDFQSDFAKVRSDGNGSAADESCSNDDGSDNENSDDDSVDFQNDETVIPESDEMHNRENESPQESKSKDSSVYFQNDPLVEESSDDDRVDLNPHERNNIDPSSDQVPETEDFQNDFVKESSDGEVTHCPESDERCRNGEGINDESSDEDSVNFQNDETVSIESDERHNIEHGSHPESENKDSSADLQNDAIEESSDDDRDDLNPHERNNIEHSSNQVPETEDFQNDFVKESSDGEVTHCPESDERCRNGEGINDESSDEDSVNFQNDETVSIESDERRNIEHGSHQESENKDSSVDLQNDAIEESSDDDRDDLNPHERNNIEHRSDQVPENEDFKNDFVKESSDGAGTHCPEADERCRDGVGNDNESSDEDSVEFQNDDLESDEMHNRENRSDEESEDEDSSVDFQYDPSKHSSDHDRDDRKSHEINNKEKNSYQGSESEGDIIDFQNDIAEEGGDDEEEESRSEQDFQNDETGSLDSEDMDNDSSRSKHNYNTGNSSYQGCESDVSSVDFRNDRAGDVDYDSPTPDEESGQEYGSDDASVDFRNDAPATDCEDHNLALESDGGDDNGREEDTYHQEVDQTESAINFRNDVTSDEDDQPDVRPTRKRNGTIKKSRKTETRLANGRAEHSLEEYKATDSSMIDSDGCESRQRPNDITGKEQNGTLGSSSEARPSKEMTVDSREHLINIRFHPCGHTKICKSYNMEEKFCTNCGIRIETLVFEGTREEANVSPARVSNRAASVNSETAMGSRKTSTRKTRVRSSKK